MRGMDALGISSMYIEAQTDLVLLACDPFNISRECKD